MCDSAIRSPESTIRNRMSHRRFQAAQNQISHSEKFDNPLSLNNPVEPALQNVPQGRRKLARGNAPGKPSQSSPASRQGRPNWRPNPRSAENPRRREEVRGREKWFALPVPSRAEASIQISHSEKFDISHAQKGLAWVSQLTLYNASRPCTARRQPCIETVRRTEYRPSVGPVRRTAR